MLSRAKWRYLSIYLEVHGVTNIQTAPTENAHKKFFVLLGIKAKYTRLLSILKCYLISLDVVKYKYLKTLRMKMGHMGSHASTKKPFNPTSNGAFFMFSWTKKHTFYTFINPYWYIVLYVHSGLAVMVFMIPLNGVVASKMKKFQISQMKDKDKRCKTMDEILNGIKGGLISESFFPLAQISKKSTKSLFSPLNTFQDFLIA